MNGETHTELKCKRPVGDLRNPCPRLLSTIWGHGEKQFEMATDVGFLTLTVLGITRLMLLRCTTTDGRYATMPGCVLLVRLLSAGFGYRLESI